MKRILFMDLSAEGHHPRYLRWMIDAEACQDAEICVVGRRKLIDHAELKGVAERIRPFELKPSDEQEAILGDTESPTALVRRQFTAREIWYKAFAELSRSGPVDLVFLAFVDDCLDSIGLAGSMFGNTPWAGITFRPMFHFQDVGVLAPPLRFSAAREFLFRRALRNRHLAGIFTIDPTLQEYADSHFTGTERKKLRFLPDPTVLHVLPSRAQARLLLGIPAYARVVLAYGALSERKGIRALVDAAADAACRRDIHVMLAGAQERDVKEYLKGDCVESLRQEGRLHVFSGYQTDADEARLLSAADCMWVGYRGFYVMSGILLLAARHGIPCLVSEAGIAGYLTKKYNCGLLVDPDSHMSIAAALLRVAQDAQGLAEAGAKGRSAFQRHSICEFQKEISELVTCATRARVQA